MSDTARSSYSNPVDWLFRSRVDGRIVVAQLPNVPLLVFLAATAVRVLLHPRGQSAVALGLVATLSLIVWAALEIVRGVNPFRRILGAVVLLGQALAFLLAR
ncbi:MAG: hypothetical protein NVSMB17_07290 [Candidatus Dormibacteria bacterium]